MLKFYWTLFIVYIICCLGPALCSAFHPQGWSENYGKKPEQGKQNRQSFCGTASLFLSNMYFLHVEPPVFFFQICTFFMWNRQSLCVKYGLSLCGTASLFLSNTVCTYFLYVEPLVYLSNMYFLWVSLYGTASLFLSNTVYTFSMWNRQSLSVNYVLSLCASGGTHFRCGAKRQL